MKDKICIKEMTIEEELVDALTHIRWAIEEIKKGNIAEACLQIGYARHRLNSAETRLRGEE